MDNLKLFETHTDYVDYEQSGNMIYPNVSRCIDQRENHYNKFKTELSTVDSNFLKRDVAEGKTLKSNYATIQSVKGNSMTWVQRWYFGGTVYYNTTDGTPDNITYGNTVSNIYFHGTFKKANSQITLANQLTLGNKYYVSMTVTCPNNPEITTLNMNIGGAFTAGWYYRPARQNYTLTNGTVNVRNIFTVVTYTSSGVTRQNSMPSINIDLSSLTNFPEGGLYIEITNINCIDLTQLYGKGNEPTTVSAFEKDFPLKQYNRTTGITVNNTIEYLVSKGSNDSIKQMININANKITGKLNGTGESITIFPQGLKSTFALPTITPSYIYKSDSKASYIDLDYVPTGNDIVIKTKIRYTSYIGTTYYLPWFTTKTSGWNETNGDNFYGILRRTNTNGNIYAFCGNKNFTEITGLTTATVYEIELSNGNLKLNGTDYTLDTTAGNENTYSMKLLAGLNAYLYYFQIYKGEDLVVDCIPYRDENVVGLQDRARNNRIFTLTQASGEGVIYSYEPTYSETAPLVYDEIKKNEGMWKAYKRVGTQRTNNNINSGRGEYIPLETAEVYTLDNQDFPDRLYVETGGTEVVFPDINAYSTPVTSPAGIESAYVTRYTPATFLSFNNVNDEEEDIENSDEEETFEDIFEEES